jgi:hypothetical protein
MFRSQDQWSLQNKVVEWGFYTIPIVALLILVAILWRHADWIAERTAAPAPDVSAPTPGVWSPQSVLRIAVTVLGLWILIDHLPALVSHVLWLLHQASQEAGTSQVAFADASLVSVLLATVLGLFCILGARTIADVVARARRW